MITAVDTNVLLDILLPDEKYAVRSKELIDTYNQKGQLIICEMVYAELSSQFLSEKNLNDFLSDTAIKLVHSSEKALALSGERWRVYSKKRKRHLQCSACGEKVSIQCPKCQNPIPVKQHIVSDFIIAAHALIHAEIFLSRDRGFFRTYFKDLLVKD